MKSESLTKDCNRITRDNTAAEPSSEHASAGNLHFLVGVNFGTLSEVDKYAAFMEEMTTLIVSKYDGSLKAEHGTGRNIAPFLEKEWGPKATALMWRIKKLFDPRGLLAPGVMLNKDPVGHLKNTHTYPEIESVANACIECGYCEPVCPSRHLTTTPRQRIALSREMLRHEPGFGDSKRASERIRVRCGSDLRR